MPVRVCVRSVGACEGVYVRMWGRAGLPVDVQCEDNALIVVTSRRWPMLVDPQGQARRWVLGVEASSGLLVLQYGAADMLSKLTAAVEHGQPCLVEGFQGTLDPALDPLLLRQVFAKAGQAYMQLGDAVVPYNKAFRLYIRTEMGNPVYTPEVAAKVTVINFVVTPVGLAQQLLTLAVRTLRPDLEEEKSKLIVTSAANQRQLRELESRILQLIASKVAVPVVRLPL